MTNDQLKSMVSEYVQKQIDLEMQPLYQAFGSPLVKPKPMNAERATFILRRFKHDEKMLGPIEQEALDFAIEALNKVRAQEELSKALCLLEREGDLGHYGRKALRIIRKALNPDS